MIQTEKATENAALVERIARRANELRRLDLRMVYGASLGHLGGDFSSAEILATLYEAVLDVSPERADDPSRDRFVLSKGHCAGGLYVTLAQSGFLSRGELSTFAQNGSRLSGHPDRKKVAGVETNTGPLGHGMPFAVGVALGAKLDGGAYRAFVLTGDGELQEGSNWEAAMSAAHFKLDNLTLIVDRNRLQLGDRTENTIGLDPLADKFRAFGWAVREVEGNDIPSLLSAFRHLPFEAERPSCVIANTRKGKGVSFMEDNPAWHHHVPTENELARALAELGEYKTDEKGEGNR